MLLAADARRLRVELHIAGPIHNALNAQLCLMHGSVEGVCRVLRQVEHVHKALFHLRNCVAAQNVNRLARA